MVALATGGYPHQSTKEAIGKRLKTNLFTYESAAGPRAGGGLRLAACRWEAIPVLGRWNIRLWLCFSVAQLYVALWLGFQIKTRIIVSYFFR